MSACGGGDSDADDASLTRSSLCEAWNAARAADQRAFAESEVGTGRAVPGLVEDVSSRCRRNKALTLEEALAERNEEAGGVTTTSGESAAEFRTRLAETTLDTSCAEPPPSEAAADACLRLIDLAAGGITSDEFDEMDEIVATLNGELG